MRPLSPGMGNESDTFLRFYQKRYFRTYSRPTDDEKTFHTLFPQWLHVDDVLRKGDYAFVPEQVGVVADKMMEDEEFRASVFGDEDAKYEFLQKGKELHLSLIHARNEYKRLAQEEVKFANSKTDEKKREAAPASLPLSENEMNRAAGRSYTYVPDYTSDSDDESDDDDWHGYHEAAFARGAPGECVQNDETFEIGDDDNINHSDPDLDTSDADSSECKFESKSQPLPTTDSFIMEITTDLDFLK